MHHLRAPGHDHREIDLDHCRPCGLVWFDQMESVQLSGLGWIHVLRELQINATTDRPQAAELRCPLCRTALKEVRNLTRFGRFPACECPSCGGHQHSQAGMLAERGLVRPLLPTERSALMTERRQLCCLNCGAPSDGRSEECGYCETPLMMVDLPRLTDALRFKPRTTSSSTLPPADGRPLAWACHGCGAPLDPGLQNNCPQCQHAVVVPSLIELEPLLETLEREWHDGLAMRIEAREWRKATYRAPAATTHEPKLPERTVDQFIRQVRQLMSDSDDERESMSPYAIVGVAVAVMFVLFIRHG